MSLNQALLLSGQLVALGLFLSGVEFMRLSSRLDVQRVWNSGLLLQEFRRSLPVPDFFRAWLASRSALRQLALAEMIVSIAALISPGAGLFLALFAIHLLICLRFRGTFNGGSDQMFLQVLLTLAFGFGFYERGYAQWALVYLAVQLLYSYFKAGLVKLTSSDWRSGKALRAFLAESAVGASPLERTGVVDERSRVLTWSVIAIELLMPLSALSFRFAFVGLSVALVFHLLNVGFFGLNRFFWAWLSAWPAVFFVTRLL